MWHLPVGLARALPGSFFVSGAGQTAPQMHLTGLRENQAQRLSGLACYICLSEGLYESVAPMLQAGWGLKSCSIGVSCSSLHKCMFAPQMRQN
jgi:hypothetical protein